MEVDTPPPVDVELMTGVLLEMAQQPSLEQLLQKLVRRGLQTPAAAIVVMWLTDAGAGAADAPPEGPAEPPCLYAVAGGDSTGADAAADQPHRLPDHLARIPLGEGPIGRIAATGQPVALQDLDKDPGGLAPIADWIGTQKIRGFMGCPIAYRGEVLGVLGGFLRVGVLEEATRWARVFADHVAGAIVVTRAFEEIRRLKARLEEQNAYLREEVVAAKAFGGLVGRSAALGQVVSQIDLVAPTDASVLILGETGTGKELVAHEVHRRSRRCDKPLVRVNCASVPKELFESEFFGHARGSFTGAVKDRAGRFETAEGGTLFLDAVGEVPLELQSKLLRVLQEKRYERVGEDRTPRADVRIVAATNRDLKVEAEAGRFREDLYYRLNVFPIRVAPLRERKEDVPLLAQHFVRRSAQELRCPEPRLTRAGVARLQAYDWPGNVRELQNVIERAVILARGGALEFDLPTSAAAPAARPRFAESPAPAARAAPIQGAGPAFLTEVEMRQRERDNLLAVLEKAAWRIKGPDGAAELLGVKATTLLSRLKAMGIRRPA